jgi:hypothetical protein
LFNRFFFSVFFFFFSFLFISSSGLSRISSGQLAECPSQRE